MTLFTNQRETILTASPGLSVCDSANAGLFDHAPRARNTDPETSHTAAAKAREKAISDRQEIVRVLRLHGPLGKDGIARFSSNLAGVEVARRTTDLVKDGLIQKTGKSVLSDKGCPEAEYAAAAAGCCSIGQVDAARNAMELRS